MMNSRERFLSIMGFEGKDSTLFWEFGYWAETVRRWYNEGLPKQVGLSEDLAEDITVTGEVIPSPELDRPMGIDVSSYMGFDKGIMRIPLNQWVYPSFERQILDETDNRVVFIDERGIKQERLKRSGSMPRFLAWPVSSREDFEQLKLRFNPSSPGRLPSNWVELVDEYKRRDYPLALGGLPVGFFGSLRELMGFENTLTAYYYCPDLVKDILSLLADFWIELWSKVFSVVSVDYVLIWEDMSYKSGSMVSPAIFREFIMPHYKRLTSFLKDNGVSVIFVDTDGNCEELIPLFLEGGVTGLLPMEVQAGMDIVEIGRRYPQLQIMGGLDKNRLRMGKWEIDKELSEKVPFMLKRGGYIPCADHLIPPDVSWDNFMYYRKRLKDLSEHSRLYG